MVKKINIESINTIIEAIKYHNQILSCDENVVIDFKNESGSVVERIIVELKWGSGLGVDQLAREWHAFNESPLKYSLSAHQAVKASFGERTAGVFFANSSSHARHTKRPRPFAAIMRSSHLML